MDRQKVKVYVRASAHEGERTLSFHPPKEVPQTEWLTHGFAIDGNSVVASVTPSRGVADLPEDIPGYPPDLHVEGRRQIRRLCTYPKISPSRSLMQALQEVEAWLVEWLGELGYDVEFA